MIALRQLYANRENPTETGDAKERIIPGKGNYKSKVLEMDRASRIQGINEGLATFFQNFMKDDNILADEAKQHIW